MFICFLWALVSLTAGCFFLQDPHIIDEVTDNHQDMDSLNRNVPEPGRQTHQVLQVRQNIEQLIAAAEGAPTVGQHSIPFDLGLYCI